MLEILRDQIWPFVAAILGVPVLILLIVAYLGQRQHKALSYEVISRVPLLSLQEETSGQIQILFEDKPVENVQLAVIKITNSGNTPITSGDYERPVSLSFGENAQILTADVTQTEPESLQPSISIENNKAVLTPVLLNSGDSIALKLLVSNSSGELVVDGRIVGVKEIREVVEKRGRHFYLMAGGIALSILAWLLSLLAVPRDLMSEEWTYVWPYFIPVALGLVMFFWGVFLERRAVLRRQRLKG